ncbi:hypothetical protein [Rhizobacter fulvus]
MSTSLIADLLDLLDVERRYEFEERAGIIEFDGGLSRDEAEALALIDLLRTHPGALIGLTAVQVENRGKPAFVLTTYIDRARDQLPTLGVTVIDIVDPVEAIKTHFGGTALLVRFG